MLGKEALATYTVHAFMIGGIWDTATKLTVLQAEDLAPSVDIIWVQKTISCTHDLLQVRNVSFASQVIRIKV